MDNDLKDVSDFRNATAGFKYKSIRNEDSYIINVKSKNYLEGIKHLCTIIFNQEVVYGVSNGTLIGEHKGSTLKILYDKSKENFLGDIIVNSKLGLKIVGLSLRCCDE